MSLTTFSLKSWLFLLSIFISTVHSAVISNANSRKRDEPVPSNISVPPAPKPSAAISSGASFLIPAGSNPVQIGAIIGAIFAAVVGVIVLAIYCVRRRKDAPRSVKTHRKEPKSVRNWHVNEKAPPITPISETPPTHKKSKSKGGIFGHSPAPSYESALPPHISGQSSSSRSPSSSRSHSPQPSFSSAGSTAPLMSNQARTLTPPPPAQIPARSRSFPKSGRPNISFPMPSRAPSPSSSESSYTTLAMAGTGRMSRGASPLKRNNSGDSMRLVRTASGRFEMRRLSQLSHTSSLSEGSTNSSNNCSTCGAAQNVGDNVPPHSHSRNGSSTSTSAYSESSAASASTEYTYVDSTIFQGQMKAGLLELESRPQPTTAPLNVAKQTGATQNLQPAWSVKRVPPPAAPPTTPTGQHIASKSLPAMDLPLYGINGIYTMPRAAPRPPPEDDIDLDMSLPSPHLPRLERGLTYLKPRPAPLPVHDESEETVHMTVASQGVDGESQFIVLGSPPAPPDYDPGLPPSDMLKQRQPMAMELRRNVSNKI